MPWATASDIPGTPSKLSCQTSPATGVPLSPSAQAPFAALKAGFTVPEVAVPADNRERSDV